MKATNKKEFFELLEAELHRIGIEDTNDIFADFEEHFTDGAMQGIPEDITAERLGDIKEIARSYLNLESSRINSIMARDVEHRKVSLTKPGRGVPADLSLIGSGSSKDIANSDNIREYTPQHFSSEIYPQSPSSSAPVNGTNVYGNGAAGTTSAGTGTGASANNAASMGAAAAAGAAGASANKSVADAFSDAGRAALDAAKLTGQVVADAFKQRGAEVKDAVTNAGKTAADAMKAAGQSAADAVRGATKSRKKTKASFGAPQPSDTYREQMNTVGNPSGRKAYIPPQHTKAKTGGYKLINSSDLTPNVNAGKLILAIVLDCILWIWVLPALIGSTFGIAFGGAGNSFITAIKAMFYSEYYRDYFICRVFLAFGYFWLGIAALCVSIFMVKLIIKLIKFIINLHIKAIYDL